jgi:hypothetical protein
MFAGAPTPAAIAGNFCFSTGGSMNAFRPIIAGLLVATATTAGVYAMAASAATSIAATFDTTESASHRRIVAFAAARADEHRAFRSALSHPPK